MLLGLLNFHRITRPVPAAPGQGGLVAIAITMMIALVIVSSALSGLSSMNANRSVVTKQSLQTYYVAQAGIQEALGTRMVPRTNYLNFSPVQQPYISRSGLVYEDPINQQNLIGEYRYIIIGGDGARQSNGTYYPLTSINAGNIPRLLATHSIPETSPFIIISKATVCKSGAGKSVVTPNQLNPGLNPTCRTGSVADELTLVAQARLIRESTADNPLFDRAGQVQAFKDSRQIRLPAGASVPGYPDWQNANSIIDFDQAWNGGTVQLRRVVFYNFSDNTVYADVPISGSSTTVGTAIPTKSVIRLYFDGAIDHRSISPTYNKQLTDCQGSGAATCRIRVMQNTDLSGNFGTAYSGNTIIPLLPSSNQVILLPPLTGQIQGGNRRHAIKVDASQMRTFNGRAGSSNFTVNFVTQ